MSTWDARFQATASALSRQATFDRRTWDGAFTSYVSVHRINADTCTKLRNTVSDIAESILQCEYSSSYMRTGVIVNRDTPSNAAISSARRAGESARERELATEANRHTIWLSE